MGLFNSKNKGAQDLFIDFENASVPSSDSSVHSDISALLARGPALLQCLDEYKGCQDLARRAMSSPSLENESAAFEGLLIAVDSIAQFFYFARDLEKAIADLLHSLSVNSSLLADQKTHLADHAALATLLAHIFEFSLRFDALRMLRPNLSNDFSYYRRLLPKFSRHPSVKIKDDEASGMTLFTAEHIPMTNALVKGARAATERSPSAEQCFSFCLSTFASSCLGMLKSKRFARTDTTLLCGRAMSGALVLFDHISSSSLFGKKRPIDVKDVVNTLRKELPNEKALLNALHYSTKNFKEATPAIQRLFD